MVVTLPYIAERRDPFIHVIGSRRCILLSMTRTNILGHKGIVAEAFGKLANDMWRSNDGFIVPSSFKEKVCN